MGQFSWLCSVCDEQILSEGETWECFKCEKEFAGKEQVMLHIPSKWNSGQLCSDWFYEPDYEGYGMFGDMDAYTLIARMNAPAECPSGIMLTPTGRVRKGLSFIAALLDTEDREAMDEDRCLGIDLAFGCSPYGETPLKYPIKITHYRCGDYLSYEEILPSSTDSNQGWVHNQHQEGSMLLCSDCWGW